MSQYITIRQEEIKHDDIGCLGIFYNIKEKVYIVSRLKKVSIINFSPDYKDEIGYLTMHDSYYPGFEKLSNDIYDKINFRATQLILK